MKALLTAITIIGFAMISWGQPIEKANYETMIETADSAYNSNDYINAIEWYGKAYKESKDKNLSALMADLHFQMGDYKKAERRYDRLVNKDKTGEYADDRYRLARAKLYQGKYAEALTDFRTYASTTEDMDGKKSAMLFITGIENMDQLSDNIEAVVTPLDKEINSALSEYSPRQYVDGTLYYAALVGKKAIELKDEETVEESTSRIYMAARNKEGGYEEPVELGTQINREGFHQGNLTFSSDGQRMYFTRAKLRGNELGDFAKIFVANKNDSGWGAAEEMPSIQGDYYTTQPAAGQLYGNEVIFFVSDMPGGFGGMDIYYTTVLGDGYSSPVNLGESINTDKDEITPFYKDGTLYFASKGYAGLGGFDIFYSSWDGSDWSEVTNMGFNYNSSYDDQYLSLSEDGSKGFLTTYRPHKDKKSIKGSKACCPDIHQVELRDIIIDLLAYVEDDKEQEQETQVLTKNESIRLNNIYYDFDKSNILPDAERDLLYLKEIMDEYPSLVIELSSHTDAQGATNYNKRLSQRRANSAARWLTKAGVDKDRIKPVGYGESNILNQCTEGVECTDDEHRFNRRTEFKILDGPETIIIKTPVSNWDNQKKN